MAKKRTNSKRKATSVKVRGRGASKRVPVAQTSRALGRYVLPVVIMCLLLGATIFLVLTGYQTATASSFFGLKNVDVRGCERTATQDVQKIVSSTVEKTGVWNADLGDLRMLIEKLPFVKSAAVSRMLPAGIRVNVTERVPAAVVKLSSGNYLVDGEGTVLALADKKTDFPFVLLGWDESKTEKAGPDNLARLKLYKKMIDEWKQFDLSSRVKEVNISNPREPVAVIEDSGRAITVTLARDNLGKSLKSAIEAISGKGAKVRSVDAEGISPVIQYLEF